MRKTIWAVGIALTVLTLPAQAEEAVRFPPYPDVWGVELPETEDCNWDDYHLNGYMVTHYGETNGDRTFMFSGKFTAENHPPYNAYSFFAKKYYVFSEDDYDEEEKNQNI
jgi:hypothetical protein